MKKEEIYLNLFITALEGGSNYWYYFPNIDEARKIRGQYSISEKIFYSLKMGNSFVVWDVEDDSFLGELNFTDFNKALKLMKSDYPIHYDNIYSENWDAETADIFLQLAVMGELIYG